LVSLLGRSMGPEGQNCDWVGIATLSSLLTFANLADEVRFIHR